jgi:hypothetical protein
MKSTSAPLCFSLVFLSFALALTACKRGEKPPQGAGSTTNDYHSKGPESAQPDKSRGAAPGSSETGAGVNGGLGTQPGATTAPLTTISGPTPSPGAGSSDQ